VQKAGKTTPSELERPLHTKSEIRENKDTGGGRSNYGRPLNGTGDLGNYKLTRRGGIAERGKHSRKETTQ